MNTPFDFNTPNNTKFPQISLKFGQIDVSLTEIIIPIPQEKGYEGFLDEIFYNYGKNQHASRDFGAEFKESVTIYAENTKIHLLGLGKNAKSKQYIHAFRWFFHTKKQKLGENLSIYAQDLDINFLDSIANGILLGGYNINLYKTDKSPETPHFFQKENTNIDIFLGENDRNIAEKRLFEGIQTAFAQMEAMNLVNQPANIKTPQYLANWAINSGKEHGYKVDVLDKKALKEQGLHALLAIGKGSQHDPCLILMHYVPKNATNPKKVAFVGKGITFDMGGISIKDNQNMHFMKSDMGGAGGMMGAIELVARLGLNIEVIGVMCVAENNIGAGATLPSDVFSSYSGKTIEMIDTDAEGRVVLADGVCYANRNFKPDILIDMATLTGNTILALGYNAGALFCNDEDLARKLLESGQNTGEKLWQMPLWDDYKDDISSDVADVRNFSGKPINGGIAAAKFIEVFTEKHPNWAHIDMAGMVLQAGDFSKDRSATAFGMRLLVDFLKNL